MITYSLSTLTINWREYCVIRKWVVAQDTGVFTTLATSWQGYWAISVWVLALIFTSTSSDKADENIESSECEYWPKINTTSIFTTLTTSWREYWIIRKWVLALDNSMFTTLATSWQVYWMISVWVLLALDNSISTTPAAKLTRALNDQCVSAGSW